jgi:hypothetical protein
MSRRPLDLVLPGVHERAQEKLTQKSRGTLDLPASGPNASSVFNDEFSAGSPITASRPFTAQLGYIA